MKVVGAIDVGSNATRMTCARITEDGRIEYLERTRTALRLGAEVFSNGFISAETEARLIENFQIYSRIFAQNDCERIRANATSAFREAKNKDELLQRVFEQTGIQIDVISGGKEAELLRKAVRKVLPLEQGNSILADLGGGSLEVSILRDGEIHFAESFRLGTVRLLQMFPYAKNKEREFIGWVQVYVKEFLNILKPKLQSLEIDRVVITGGNSVAIAKISEKLHAKLEKSDFKKEWFQVQKNELKAVIKQLSHLSFEERIDKFSLNQDRTDVILPAMFVFDRLLRVADSKSFFVPDVGVRDGILSELLEEYSPTQVQTEYQQIIYSAFYYAQKYQMDLRHAKTVRRLSIQLFDGTVQLHQYGHKERIFLEVASILHDIGRFIRPSNHHKHSSYLIQNMELVGFTDHERKMISLIARYHTRSEPSEKHPEYARLAKHEQNLIRVLSAILRVSDALDREHRSTTHSIIVHITDTQLHLIIEGEEDWILNGWALQKKKLLFEEVFAKEVVVQFS